jgi:hypothetical protein
LCGEPRRPAPRQGGLMLAGARPSPIIERPE